MLLGKLIPVWTLVLALLGICSVASLAQETPEEAKRRAAMEAERRAEEEKRKAIEDELRRKEAQGRAGAESDWDALSATISGQVNDALGKTVAGASIFASWDDAKCSNDTKPRIQSQEVGVSADDGSFRFIHTVKLLKSVTNLEVSFYASHVDHMAGEAKIVSLTRDSQVDDLQLALAAGGTISGRVTDSADRALEYATVVAANHVGPRESKARLVTRKARTDAAGNYTIKGLPTDKYTVTVECPGYKGIELNGTPDVTAGESRQGVDLTLAITTAVRGKIEVSQMSDFRVGNCSFYEGETCVKVCSLVVHDDKTFTVIDPPVGTWEIEISWWRYESVKRTGVTISEGQHADVGNVEVEVVIRELPND